MLNEFNSNEVIKYKRNLVNINKSSKYLFYFFIFIALLQIFVLVNGVSQLDLIYSERVVILEKQFDQIKDEISSKSNIDKEIDTQKLLNNKLIEKNKVYKNLMKEANNGRFFLVRNALKVFLMSLVWAYGFLKLSNFN